MSDWRENVEYELYKAVDSVFYSHGSKKQGITSNNGMEMRKYELQPYFKTRDFRKKFAPLYVQIIASHAEEAKGRFPVFKVSKQEIDRLVKKSGSASSFRVKKNGNNTSNHFHNSGSNSNALRMI